MGLLSKKHKVNKNKSFKESFLHAYDGIKYVFIEERNMHIHLFFAIMVIFFGAFFEISYTEWLVCLVLIGIVIALEMINTAIENTVNMITINENNTAKLVKDVSAGAVLVMSIIAAFIGIIIFLPKAFNFILNIVI